MFMQDDTVCRPNLHQRHIIYPTKSGFSKALIPLISRVYNLLFCLENVYTCTEYVCFVSILTV